MNQNLLRGLALIVPLAPLTIASAVADVAPGPASGGWWITGGWILAGFAALFILAFLLARVLPKSKDDNPDSPL